MEMKVLHEHIQHVRNKWNKWRETCNQTLPKVILENVELYYYILENVSVILENVEMMTKWSFELLRLNIAQKH